MRWLLSVSKVEKAEKVMKHVAKFNKATNVPETFFQINVEPDAIQKTTEKTSETQPLGILQLFRPPILIVTVALAVQW